MTSSTPIKQYRRRSSCSTIALVVATAAMTSSTSAFTQRNYHGSVIILRQSSTLVSASIGMDKSRGSITFDRPLNLIDDSSLEKHLSTNNKHSCQEEKKNMDMDNNEWELRLYDDKTKTWEEVADALVLVTGSSDPDAFKTMISANKNGFARVGNILCYEVAEMYNERLQKQGILSEIVQVISDGGDSNSEWE
eukprot:CAMPEP_0170850212 /NCGR_PEP_ID=MMETSP0734-20130129/10475_1 /TAXON_ID=186038 /ORGANISM="Fragilariopsis kerguelensis, Strain L26-C5" /LENGTH=192 /DNA_ID=CAMNT_0011220041 /DNA_START=35 /DNA_END=613 /DNA_ORIENTATION=-